MELIMTTLKMPVYVTKPSALIVMMASAANAILEPSWISLSNANSAQLMVANFVHKISVRTAQKASLWRMAFAFHVGWAVKIV
jgi:hypothetical protein